MKNYKLYVDESGNSHTGNFARSPYYILVGCIIDERYQGELKEYADQIKFKYWNRTNVVFHSAEMPRNDNDFSIFAEKPELKKEFQKDLLLFLHQAKVSLTVCIVDKKIANKKGWEEKKVVETTAKSIMGSFIGKITANIPSNGKMIFEISNGLKDKIYLESFNYLISPDFRRVDPDYTDVRSTLTSINFVTKQNHDIETQISDLFAYAAKCKLQADTGIFIYPAGSYESRLINALESKLIKTPTNIGNAKKKFYNKIKPFEIIP